MNRDTAGIDEDRDSYCQKPLPEDAFSKMIQLLSQRSLFLLRNYFHYCRLPAGTDFDWQKENSEEFGVGVLLSGKVASIRREDSIKTVFSDEIFRSGMLVGDDGFLCKFRQGRSVTALENSELLLMSRDSYAQLEAQHPELAALIMKWLLNLLTDRLIWSQADDSSRETKEQENE